MAFWVAFVHNNVTKLKKYLFKKRFIQIPCHKSMSLVSIAAIEKSDINYNVWCVSIIANSVNVYHCVDVYIGS